MSALIEKAKLIRLFILDVDGVLTSGSVTYTKEDDEKKNFHMHDGLGLKLLQKSGIIVGLISGRKSPVVARRAEELGIQHVYLGHEDKVPVYEELKKKLNLEDQLIAYMGDDLPDLPLLLRAGFAASVPNAPHYIQERVDLVATKPGGYGAVREVCEYILNAQEKFAPLLASYINR